MHAVPISIWRCTCGSATEHQLDWHGHDQQHVEWRRTVAAIMTARLLGQIDAANNALNETSAVHLRVYTRADKKAWTYVQPPKKTVQMGTRLCARLPMRRTPIRPCKTCGFKTGLLGTTGKLPYHLESPISVHGYAGNLRHQSCSATSGMYGARKGDVHRR